jgi:hypothetical protein
MKIQRLAADRHHRQHSPPVVHSPSNGSDNDCVDRKPQRRVKNVFKILVAALAGYQSIRMTRRVNFAEVYDLAVARETI